MAPVVHGLESTYCNEVNFVYLDIDDNSNLSFKEALGYVYQPHFFLLDGNGNILAQWVGYTEGETLEAALLDAIGE